jgi:hypothetical protein
VVPLLITLPLLWGYGHLHARAQARADAP